MRTPLAIVPLAAVFAACVASESSGPLGSKNDAGQNGGFRDAATPGTPCAASDSDGDGFGRDPSCGVDRDCNDDNLNIYPGAPEACNGLDDDCDNLTDEDLGSGACGRGACRRTVDNCEAGRPVACTPGTPIAETCNNIDDDCNGVIDDGVGGVTCGVGACASTAMCENGGPGACVPGTPQPESCNRRDDNCDGTTDEGFRATVFNETYTMLRGFHSVCDGAGQRMGPDCNAAINRYCAQSGCTTAGFGPLENSGDVSVIGCVAAEPGRDVPYAMLATFHPPCDGTTERIGPNCNAAIHRYCASLGYASGFGPGESGQDAVLVTCLRPGAATVVSTLYSVLVGHHDGCDGGAGRYGPACNAAINRFCASSGYTTGFGPVENNGDTAIVTCVSP